jgi:hypothetical protein
MPRSGGKHLAWTGLSHAGAFLGNDDHGFSTTRASSRLQNGGLGGNDSGLRAAVSGVAPGPVVMGEAAPQRAAGAEAVALLLGGLLF